MEPSGEMLLAEQGVGRTVRLTLVVCMVPSGDRRRSPCAEGPTRSGVHDKIMAI
jgi:hypothetical protein